MVREATAVESGSGSAGAEGWEDQSWKMKLSLDILPLNRTSVTRQSLTSSLAPNLRETALLEPLTLSAAVPSRGRGAGRGAPWASQHLGSRRTCTSVYRRR